MTLEDAIIFHHLQSVSADDMEISEYHAQLREWLSELKLYRILYNKKEQETNRAMRELEGKLLN